MRGMRFLVPLAFAVVVGGTAFAALRMGAPAPAIRQPIPFNHHKHVVEEEGPKLACTECHPGATTAANAGLPSLDRCLQCHMKPQSKRPEERIVRELAAKGGPFEWIQVTRNAGHVYFSHRAHITLGKLECATCHGDVASWTEPPARPELRLEDMQACLNCHRERGAQTSCRTCHR
jgi:c(7)-type cytochrome triheme protein